MEKDVEIGIFGGTGIYDSGLLENAQEIEIDTPYGKPSDTITVGIFKGRKIAFLPRHGKKHTIPHMINFKANMGIQRIRNYKNHCTISSWKFKRRIRTRTFCFTNTIFRLYKI